MKKIIKKAFSFYDVEEDLKNGYHLMFKTTKKKSYELLKISESSYLILDDNNKEYFFNSDNLLKDLSGYFFNEKIVEIYLI